MDWKVFLAAFSGVFFAELADKTQMVGIGLSAKSGKPVAVLLGSVAGYLLVTVVSVFLGALFARFIRPDAIRYAGALIFIGMGVLMLFKVL